MPKYRVEECVVINAPFDEVRAIVRDFRKWEKWSPWLSAEPDCKLDYAEDGNSYAWDGKVIGSGKMAIVDETKNKILYKLNFFSPFKSEARVDFTFEEDGDKVKAIWGMDGSLPFFMFFMTKMMKAWISVDYTRGLMKLKDLAETGDVPSTLSFDGPGEGLVTKYIGIRSTKSFDKVGPEMAKHFPKLAEALSDQEIDPSGQPFAIYEKTDMVGKTLQFVSAIPVAELPKTLEGEIISGQVNAPKTYKVTHKGAYRHLGSAWSAGMMRARNKAFKHDKKTPGFELYVSDPQNTDEKDLITEIHLPIKG